MAEISDEQRARHNRAWLWVLNHGQFDGAYWEHRRGPKPTPAEFNAWREHVDGCGIAVDVTNFFPDVEVQHGPDSHCGCPGIGGVETGGFIHCSCVDIEHYCVMAGASSPQQFFEDVVWR